jgi:hydrogenase maturation factor HypE
MIMLLTLILAFVLFHAPGGAEVVVNTQEISSIRQVTELRDEHLHKDVHCIIVMSNGKAIGLVETCRDVIKALADTEQQ